MSGRDYCEDYKEDECMILKGNDGREVYIAEDNTKQERILIRSTYRQQSTDKWTWYTSISFIPVCDNCNYVFPEVSGKVGDLYVEPCVCPKCNKIIECVRLPIIDASGKLNYE